PTWVQVADIKNPRMSPGMATWQAGGPLHHDPSDANVFSKLVRHQPGGCRDDSGYSSDDADYREHHLPGDEIQRAEHETDLEKAFAEIETQRTVLGVLRLFLFLL